MQEAILMIFCAALQGLGAYYAFNTDGVLAKLAGLFFCIIGLGCLIASLVFANDYTMKKKKGE